MAYDIVIQAGHEGGWRNNAGRGKTRTSGTLGVPGGPSERHLTPLVADKAAELLGVAGYRVLRVPALYPRKLKAKLSIAIHFDGATNPCKSGASVGYPVGKPAGSNEPAAKSWSALYAKVWPFRFMPPNFTRNLSGYYGFGWVSTTDAELVIELGELTCLVQQEWLVERVESGYLGQLIAHWASVRLGGDRVPMPEAQASSIDVAGINDLLVKAQGVRMDVVNSMDTLRVYLQEIQIAIEAAE